MGMNMHEKRRFQPTSTVVLEASLFICQTNSLGTSMFSLLCVYGSNIGILVAQSLHAPYRKQHITENDNDAVVTCYI